jgi:hypothetical protein
MAKVQLATPLKPSSEVFQHIGVQLGEITGNKYSATLPKGWTYRRVKGNVSTETVVYDEKGRARIHCNQVFAKYLAYVKSETRLYRRYSIQVINRHDNHPEGNYEVVLCKIEQSFENQVARLNDDIIFSAGRTSIEPQYDLNTHQYSSSHNVVRLCMEYANKNFPDWLNPEAYWD